MLARNLELVVLVTVTSALGLAHGRAADHISGVPSAIEVVPVVCPVYLESVLDLFERAMAEGLPTLAFAVLLNTVWVAMLPTCLLLVPVAAVEDSSSQHLPMDLL